MPTLTLTPSADAFLLSHEPDANAGSTAAFWVGESSVWAQIYRGLIKFDLSSLPAGAEITSCVLSLYCYADQSTNARTYRVYRQKRAWVEGQATWNIYSTGNSWQTAGGFGSSDCEQSDIGSRDFEASDGIGEFKHFSLTPVTKAALDLGNGWLIKADTENSDAYYFYSSEWSTENQRPYLTIEYVGGVTAMQASYRRRRV